MTVAFCAFFFVLIIGAAWTFFRLPWRALRTGRFEPGRGVVIYRHHEPLRFWFLTAMFGFGSVGMVYIAASGLITLAGALLNLAN